jgi:hypothetical protein
MTTKPIKRTIEETIGAQDEIVEKVVAVEMAVIDDNGNDVGHVNVNLWGGNFNFNMANIDIEVVANSISELLNNLKK